ncbi:MAG: DUF4358 domain-containing protein [Clostridia bacterium]|nr:DUF4358 domain-containing protein [Clostridia bacterium]
MNRQRIFEIVCVVALVIFIGFMSAESTYSDKTASEVAESVIKSYDVSELQHIKKNKIREEFDIDFSVVESFEYYASDSIMTVDELMIIKLKEEVKPDEISEKIAKRAADKQVLFEGYAPEQSALLKEYILKYDKGFIFYAVGESADEAFAAFKSSVR